MVNEAIEYQLIANCFQDFAFNRLKSVNVFSTLLFSVYLSIILNKTDPISFLVNWKSLVLDHFLSDAILTFSLSCSKQKWIDIEFWS